MEIIGLEYYINVLYIYLETKGRNLNDNTILTLIEVKYTLFNTYEGDKTVIKLNDILQLTEEEIGRTKLRFMVKSYNVDFDPIKTAKDEKKRDDLNLKHLVHNQSDKIYFKKDVIAIGFIPLENDKWLLTGIVDVIKDNGYSKTAKAIHKDKKYNFRLVVNYHKTSQNGILNAKTLINKLEVWEIWDDKKGLIDKNFPGYNKVKIDYDDLAKKLKISDEWLNALKSRRGIYLITDKKNGKLYVGAAYGQRGILGRWEAYIKSGYDKGEKESGTFPNKKLKEIVRKKGIEYIRDNFQYSILETFTEDTSDEDIINRESWWKRVLLTREFGYNAN